MKKLLWIVGGLFIALLVALASIPLFVDVDQYRPQITAEANKHINGKVELGKLHLSLWGAIKIHAESIQLQVNGFPGNLVEAKEFHLEIPFLSVFSGKPQVVAVLSEPNISVVKETSGKTNALELLPKGEGAAASVSAPASPAVPTAPSAPQAPVAKGSAPSTPGAPAAPSAPTQPGKLPALLAGARLGLRIENGNLRYTDKVSKSEYGVKGLELEAKNIGLGSPMSLHMKAPLQGKTPSLTFAGPVELSANLEPILEGTSVKSARGDLDLDATRLAIHMPGKFEKSDSMPLTAKMRIEGNDKETLLRQLEVVFDQFKLHGKGRVTLSPVNVKLDFNLDPARLDTLKNFVPMLAAYDLKGTLALSTNVDMTPAYFHLNGDLKASDGSFFLKNVLKAPMQFQVQAGFSENSLNLSRASLSAPDSDLQLVGHVKNFLAPQFSFAITGKSFNLDKAFVMGEPAKSAGLSLFPEAYAAPPPAEKNPLSSLFANPVFAKASGLVNAQIGKVVVEGATLEQVQAKAELKSGNLHLEDAGFHTFGGIVNANGNFDLKSPGLRFATAGSVSGVSGKDAFTNYFPKYKDTLEGSLSADWNVSGALYPATARIRSLQGKAKLVATDGVLKSVDFQDSINSAMKKVPFLKGKKPIQVDDGFKTLTANLSFGGGVIKAEPIDVQPRGKGFVVKGKSTIQENLDQETFFDLYDPQGILPRDIEQPGKPALALRLYGPLTAPKTDYGYTVEKLASNAGKNALKNAAGKALDKFLGGQQGGNKGGDALKDAADKLKKKFKFF